MTSPTSSLIAGSHHLFAADTSAAAGSVALGSYVDGECRIVGERGWTKLAMHSEAATVEAKNLLDNEKMDFAAVDFYAVNVGPGSFTGLRVGINLIRTLAYSFAKPVAMFTSLEVLAYENANEGEKVLIATRAIQNFYYAAVYQKTAAGIRTLVAPFSAVKEDFAKLKDYDRTLIEGLDDVAPTKGARTLVQMCANAQFSSWKNVKPLYVRASEAEEKLKRGILKPLA